MDMASSIVHHFNLRVLQHHHGPEKHGTLDHSYCTMENFTSYPLLYMKRNLILSFSCDRVHYHFYPSSNVHFSSTECCRVLSDVLICLNREKNNNNNNNKLNISSLFGTGADEWEIDKTLNNRAAKMTPSLKSCLFRDCQVGLLSQGTIWWGRYYLVRPVLSA